MNEFLLVLVNPSLQIIGYSSVENSIVLIGHNVNIILMTHLYFLRLLRFARNDEYRIFILLTSL
jgi:hypothetical protein